MKSEFMIERQGKSFCLYAGLLDEAHAQGLKRITTKLLQIPSPDNGQVAICYAEVETEKGTFTGLGDAAPENVSRLMVPHLIRFAETRSKARALRDAINVGVAALEELGEEHEEAPEPASEKQLKYIYSLAGEVKGWDTRITDEELVTRYGTEAISKAQASEFLDWLKGAVRQAAPTGNGRAAGTAPAEVSERPKPAPAAARPAAAPQAAQPAQRPAAPQGRPAAPAPSAPATGTGATPAQVRALYLIGRDQHGLSEAQVEQRALETYGRLPSKLTKREASELITKLKT